MPKHRVFYFVTDEEARTLELASLAMKYVGFVGVEQALLRLVESGTRPTISQTLQTNRPTSKPNTPNPNPTVRNVQWLAKPDQHIPTVPQVD